MVSPGPRWIGRENLEREISEFRYRIGIVLLVVVALGVVSIAITIFLYLINQPLWSIFLIITILIFCSIIGVLYHLRRHDRYTQKRWDEFNKIYDEIERKKA